MLKCFFAGALFNLILYFLRFIFILVVSKYYRESFKNNFGFDLIAFLFETFFLGGVFFLIFVISESFIDQSLLVSCFSILVISLIPSYSFVIYPIRHLFKQKDCTEFSRELINSKADVLKDYNIKVLDREIMNAYATGIIPFSKTILIGKPLMENLNNDELLSIILHEAGHLKMNHLNKLYFVNLIIAGISYFLFQVRSIFIHFESELLNVILVGITGSLVGFMLWYLPGKIQYRYELEADMFSAKNNGSDNLIDALKIMDKLSNGDVSKGGITHPSLSDRIKNIQNL